MNREYNTFSHSNHAWQQWAIRIEKHMQQQDQQIQELKLEIAELQRQLQEKSIDSSKAAPVFHVDKIEYHFDQLKVDTLEGSLQIGLSASSASSLPLNIEELAFEQNHAAANKAFAKSQPAPAYPDPLHLKLHQYLEDNGEEIIRQKCNDYPFTFQDEHIKLMLYDLLKQIPDRVQYYRSLALDRNEGKEGSDQEIYDKTKHDLNAAIEQYIIQSANEWERLNNDN